MGDARWSAKDWDTYSTSTSAKPAAAIFTTKHLHPTLDPTQFTVRECLDSASNPLATPIMIGADVTGSMGMLADTIVKKGLGIIMQAIYDRKPVPDPQIMLLAIGDAYCDRAPIQATQFEPSMVLTEQIEKIYIEGGGGGNAGESYLAAWYLAATKTKCSAISDRGKKGYLFTIGDEPPLETLTKGQIKEFFGTDAQADVSSRDLLALISPQWEVFHLIVKPVGGAETAWRNLLGQRAMLVTDHNKLAEVIVSAIQVVEGADAKAVAASWSGATSLVVAEATKGLTTTRGSAGGAVRL